MADRVYGWRQVAVILASSDSSRLLLSLGITPVEDRVRTWARGLLSSVEDLYEVYGIDPHKASHTAVALDHAGAGLAEIRLPASRATIEQLLGWAERWPDRTWAPYAHSRTLSGA